MSPRFSKFIFGPWISEVNRAHLFISKFIFRIINGSGEQIKDQFPTGFSMSCSNLVSGRTKWFHKHKVSHIFMGQKKNQFTNTAENMFTIQMDQVNKLERFILSIDDSFVPSMHYLVHRWLIWSDHDSFCNLPQHQFYEYFLFFFCSINVHVKLDMSQIIQY